MFENLSESEARAKMLELTEEYYQRYKQRPAYQQGDRIPYAARVFNAEEMKNLVDASLEFWLTAGRYTLQFEKELAAFLGVENSLLVNSGSSANLLAFMALTSPLLGERRVLTGDEVITVAAGFPTTVTPIIQYGAVPVFADVGIPSYNINTDQLEALRTPKTKAVMLAHTLGNPFDIARVKAFCGRHGLWLIEDNCDSLGSAYTLNGEKKYTGTFGDIGTSSFYPPHHMTTGEGGAVYTSDPLLYKIMLSMRDWGRDCVCPSGHDNFCGHRFDKQYGTLPLGYDHKYVYSHFGYNLKATDLQAAVGCAQLKKLDSFIEKRKHNWSLLRDELEVCSDRLILPETAPNADPAWFGFLITVKPGGITRNGIVKELEGMGIQTRMLFAGNLIKHPCFDAMRKTCSGYRTPVDLSNTDIIMNDTFWVGVYPGMTDEMVLSVAGAIRKICRGIS